MLVIAWFFFTYVAELISYLIPRLNHFPFCGFCFPEKYARNVYNSFCDWHKNDNGFIFVLNAESDIFLLNLHETIFFIAIRPKFYFKGLLIIIKIVDYLLFKAIEMFTLTFL